MGPLDSERVVGQLRELYRRYGYIQYKMSKFEPYDLYVQNKSFLVSEDILTFTDADGRLMALKPDVTLSIVKNAKEGGGLQKVYYSENVYRTTPITRSFQEIMQTGLECVGEVDLVAMGEVLLLAARSLELISGDYLLDVSHLGFVAGLLDSAGVEEDCRDRLLELMGEKNTSSLGSLCRELGLAPEVSEDLCRLAALFGPPGEALPVLEGMVRGERMEAALQELRTLCASLGEEARQVSLEHQAGLPRAVLRGGRYDPLAEQFRPGAKAVGFALYLDELERLSEAAPPEGEKTMLNIALPKGRLGDKVYNLLAGVGCGCPEDYNESRKLVVENREAGIRYFLVKPSDVAIYVEHGAADAGIVGKDILAESGADVYELLDTGLGKCRMCVAGPEDFTDDPGRTLRVATKFVNIAKAYYAAQGRDIDIIKLNGSIELAPLLGLSDVIVDIVETGTTLRENHLKVLTEFMPISARFVANRAGFQFKRREIETLLAKLTEVTGA